MSGNVWQLCVEDIKAFFLLERAIYRATMLRLSIAALLAVLAAAKTPDNVSSRLMIHVSSSNRNLGSHVFHVARGIQSTLFETGMGCRNHALGSPVEAFLVTGVAALMDG